MQLISFKVYLVKEKVSEYSQLAQEMDHHVREIPFLHNSFKYIPHTYTLNILVTTNLTGSFVPITVKNGYGHLNVVNKTWIIFQ